MGKPGENQEFLTVFFKNFDKEKMRFLSVFANYES